MKNLHLPVFIFTLSLIPSVFAFDCGVLPDCAELGFTQEQSACPDAYQVCPFNTNKVVCVDNPAVGDVKHSLRSSNHEGWLLCDGSAVSRDTYKNLYNLIGTKFGSGNGSTTFNVPDYRGFFLRAAGSNANFAKCKNGTADIACTGAVTATTNTSIYPTPQKEQLPNITGSFPLDTNATGSGQVKNAFSVDTSQHGDWSGKKTGSGCIVTLDASRSSGIYKNSAHVIPANYATYIFIYAGQ